MNVQNKTQIVMQTIHVAVLSKIIGLGKYIEIYKKIFDSILANLLESAH